MRGNLNQAKKAEFYRWYAGIFIIAVATLTFLIVPSARERLKERVSGLLGQTVKKQATIPVPATLSPSDTIASATPSTLPGERKPSQAEIYLNAAFNRNRQMKREETPTADQTSAANSRSAAPPPSARPVLRKATSADRRTQTPAAEEAEARAPKARTTDTATAGTSSPASTTDPSSGANSQAAYKILLDKVPAMASLQGNSLAGMQFVGWKTVKEEEPEVWIAVTGRTVDSNQEESFVWRVNVSEMTVQPLSLAARRLAAIK